MSVVRAPLYRGAAASVLRWCELYTRGLPEQVAAERRDEIASDLHEHSVWANEQGVSARALARGIRLRAVSGALADLSWRRQQMRQHESPEQQAVRTNARGGLPLVAYTLSLLALVASGFVVIRVLVGVAQNVGVMHDQATASALLAVAASLCGLALMSRRRTRWLGALWMIVALYCLVRYAPRALAYASASSSQLSYSTHTWDTWGKVLVIGLSLFFMGMAVRWMPSRSQIAHGVTVATEHAARVADSINVGAGAAPRSARTEGLGG